jgi:alpha-mannosidase
MGIAILDAVEIASPPQGTAWQKGRMLGNEFLELTVGTNGSLHLRDRRNHQQFRDLLVMESSGDVGDTYTYCAPRRDRLHRARGPVRIRSLASGPLVSALEVRWRMTAGRGMQGERHGSVGFTLVVSLYTGCPTVRCTLELDNRASNHRLRARFHSGVAGMSAVAGAPFGVEARGPLDHTTRKYARETPVATAPAQRFVAHAAGSRGLALFAPGFFEYELDRKGDLLFTVLRAIGDLSRGDLSTRPGHAGWPTPTPLAQGHGTERLQLAFAPITSSELSSGTVLPELWEDLFLPVHGIWLRQATPLAPPPIDIRLEGYGLVFSALKPAERGDAMVLRCYNATAKPTAGLWHFGQPVSSARRARADERPLHDIRLGEGGHSVPFHATPHEIVTIVVSLASPS